jgi:hypothetical protein
METKQTCTGCKYLTSAVFTDPAVRKPTTYYGCLIFPGVITGFSSPPEKSEPPLACTNYTKQREE